MLGDDLGVSHFFYANARLDYLNIPFVKSIGAKVFSVGEVAYYPKSNNNWKGSLGFGISLPINEMISIGLFHNFANFGSKVGDIERSGLLNFTL